MQSDNRFDHPGIKIDTVLDKAMLSLIIMDSRYNIQFITDAAAKILQSLVGEKIATGFNLKKVLSSKSYKALSSDLKNAFKGKSCTSEYTFTDKIGELQTFKINLAPCLPENSDLQYVSIALQDNTDLVRTKFELTKSEKLIESLFHTADIGIAVVNSSGLIIRTNEGFSKMFGYSCKELIRKPFLKIIPPFDLSEAKSAEAAILNGKSMNFERKGTRKDGSVIDLYITNTIMKDADGTLFIVKTIRDISESKKYKDLLHEAEKITKTGGFELDPASGIHIWTDEMYNIYEVSRDFIPSVNRVLKFFFKEHRPVIKQVIYDAIHKGKGWDATWQFLSGKKNIKWLRVRANPILINNKTFKLIGTVQDVTDQKKAEQEIVRLSWVASHTSNPVIITDEVGKIEWVNDSFEKLTGYNPKELKGELPGRILEGPDTNKDTVRRISQRLKRQLPSSNEILLSYTKQGRPIWVSTEINPIFKEGKLINFIGIMTDLTDLVKAQEIQEKQETLMQQQKLFNAIARFFPNGIIGVIDENFSYVFIGGTDLKKLGLRHRELIGNRLFDKMHPELNEYAESFLRRTFLNENVTFEVKISDNIYSVIAVPITNGEEAITQSLVVMQNITLQKETEGELMNAVEKQKELNDLKSKFVSIASHEFRTPLSTIISSSYLLGKYSDKDNVEKRGKHLDRIKRSANNLSEILDDFLNLGKIEAGGLKNEPDLFNISDLLNEVFDEMKSYLKNGQQIMASHKGEEMVYLDRRYLKNVLINLISNASKYSSEGKTVEIISVCNKETFEISVRDEGIGIPQEDQENLFQTFFRANNVSNIQGTGMGLHIVKKYVELMGGNINVISHLNEGTTFTVNYPLPKDQKLNKVNQNSCIS